MVKSIGGKVVTVAANGADVHLEWADIPGGQDGDMLLTPDDARKLGQQLIETADKTGR